MVAEAEDAEEFEQEGDSPHGIYITDIPDRKVGSGKPKEVAEVSWRLDVHILDSPNFSSKVSKIEFFRINVSNTLAEIDHHCQL